MNHEREKWVCFQGPNDGDGWFVVPETCGEPNIMLWPRIARVTYADEAVRICRAHNYGDFGWPLKPGTEP